MKNNNKQTRKYELEKLRMLTLQKKNKQEIFKKKYKIISQLHDCTCINLICLDVPVYSMS